MKLISSRRCSWLLTLSQADYLVKFHGGYHGDVLVLFRAGHHGRMIGNNTGKVLLLFLLLFFAGYHGGIFGHNTRKVLFLILVLVPGKSPVIALRRSYSDGCRRKQIR
jgi:hypothetical protein